MPIEENKAIVGELGATEVDLQAGELGAISSARPASPGRCARSYGSVWLPPLFLLWVADHHRGYVPWPSPVERATGLDHGPGNYALSHALV